MISSNLYSYRKYKLFRDIKSFDEHPVDEDLSFSLGKCHSLSHETDSCIGVPTKFLPLKYGALLHKLYAELELRAVKGLVDREKFEECRRQLSSELKRVAPTPQNVELCYKAFEKSCRFGVYKNPILRCTLGIYDGGKRKILQNPREMLSGDRFTRGGLDFDEAIKRCSRRYTRSQPPIKA